MEVHLAKTIVVTVHALVNLVLVMYFLHNVINRLSQIIHLINILLLSSGYEEKFISLIHSSQLLESP